MKEKKRKERKVIPGKCILSVGVDVIATYTASKKVSLDEIQQHQHSVFTIVFQISASGTRSKSRHSFVMMVQD